MLPSRACVHGFAFLAVIVFAATDSRAKPSWLPITPEELAEKKASVEPDAPAEVVFRILNVDDSDFPQSRVRTEYIRYKIFRPDSAESVTRIARSDWAEIHARLISPAGVIQEFGAEAVKERDLVKQGRGSGFLGWLSGPPDRVKEKFLAVGGVEAGSILEYQILSHDYWPSRRNVWSMQFETLPVRRIEYTCRTASDSEYLNRTFALNPQGGQYTEDKKRHTVKLVVSNLPPISDEPFEGPLSDRSLVIVSDYDFKVSVIGSRSDEIPSPGAVSPTLGPWAYYATTANWVERDHGYPTERVTRLAAQLTAAMKGDQAKADAIHRYVRNLMQDWLHTPPGPPRSLKPLRSLDNLLDEKKDPEFYVESEDFLWLATCLYKSVGLECHGVLLPNFALPRFKPTLAAPAFLPYLAAVVRINGEWMFSSPHNNYPLPFGLLPPEQAGQIGLLALDHKQEFIPVPSAPAEASLIATAGDFALDAAGTLTGVCHLSLSGYPGIGLRTKFRDAESQEERAKAVLEFLSVDSTKIELTIQKTDELDDWDKPLAITAAIRWPGYATVTKTRLIVPVNVFQASEVAPFSATRRLYPVHMSFFWKEASNLTIQVPADFAPEAPSAPATPPPGILSSAIELGYDRTHRTLHVNRTFMSKLQELPVSDYAKLKLWLDEEVRADRHEIIFASQTARAAAGAAAAAAR